MSEREIFVAAKAIPNADERSAFLLQACGTDAQLRARIEWLLQASQLEDSFLQLPETTAVDKSGVAEGVGTAIGPYKLLEQIGEGGFGVVFMAEQREPVRRTVALKIIKPGMDSRQVIARFEAERQALAIMDHPHIAKVFDAGTTDSVGRPYFIMELVKGIPITSFCDRHRLTVRQRLELFVPVCHAIQHAHNKGVIHRDIKPGNVLVAMCDDRPTPKVIDFGVAKATGHQLTERTLHTGFGSVVGSLEYMSPEQASFNQVDVDTRSDVYSLGVLLYELLTGSPPFTADELRRVGLLESLRAIRESEPPRPSVRLSTAEGLPSLAASRRTEPARLPSLVKGELDWMVLKALEKDRHRRYETVHSLAEEVDRYLRGEPVRAHPPSRWYVLRKMARRNWQPLSFALIVSALLLVGAAALWVNVRNRSERMVQHSARVAKAIEVASHALGMASSAPVGRDAEWVAARASAGHLQDLLKMQPVQDATHRRATEFLEGFRQANADRQLAEQIETVVIMSATHEDLASWQRMERQFRELFAAHEIELDGSQPLEVARRIREHRSAERLCDALELWIGTLGQISTLGGTRMTRDTMQPWAEAMYAADPDSVRTGIRRLIYSGQIPKLADVDAVVDGVQLESLSPRTLSWLANVYFLAGAIPKSDGVFHLAARQYPGDFMLNFDFAYMLANQQRWSESIRYYLRCVAIRPQGAGIWRALGNAYRENKELERSREALQRAVEHEPDHDPIHLDLARTLLELDDFTAAEAAAREAIRLEKNPSSMAQFCLGRALLGQERFAESLVTFQECQRLGEKDPRTAIEVKEWIEQCKQKLVGQEEESLRERK